MYNLFTRNSFSAETGELIWHKEKEIKEQQCYYQGNNYDAPLVLTTQFQLHQD